MKKPRIHTFNLGADNKWFKIIKESFSTNINDLEIYSVVIKRILTMICSVAIAFSGCRNENKTFTDKQKPYVNTHSDFQQDRLEDSVNKIKLDSVAHYLYSKYALEPENLFINFGSPSDADTSSIKNRHTNDNDFIYKYKFHNTDVAIYHATGSNRYLLSVVATSDISQLSTFGITQFISPEDLRYLIGRETSSQINGQNILNLEYEVGDAGEVLSFVFHNNKLDSLIFIPYLD